VGTLWRSCAKVREPVELLFRVVSGLGQDIGVLDGVHVPQREGEVLGERFAWHFECILKTKMYLTAFPYKQYRPINEIVIFLAMYFVTRSKLAFTRNLLKCNSDFTKKSRLAATLPRG